MATFWKNFLIVDKSVDIGKLQINNDLLSLAVPSVHVS